jgi:O-antigen biosynthesis protein
MPKRLISWTGERMVPWADEPAIIHEHLHRYLFSSQFVAGKAVIDLGSGEGYGSSLLAGTAARVLGIEIDPLAVEHARLNYRAPNLEFREGSVLKLDDLEPGSFDVAVCFEVIEHISDHDKLVSSVARLLRPGGVFVVSTPDREVYNASLGHVNPYHLKELDKDEFSTLLYKHFSHVTLYGQRASVGSLLHVLDEPERAQGHSHYVVQGNEGAWSVVPEPEPKYLVAVACLDSPVPVPATSLLSDAGLQAPPEPAMHVRHPILGVALLGARSVMHAVRRRVALAMRERNRRREGKG